MNIGTVLARIYQPWARLIVHYERLRSILALSRLRVWMPSSKPGGVSSLRVWVVLTRPQNEPRWQLQ